MTRRPWPRCLGVRILGLVALPIAAARAQGAAPESGVRIQVANCDDGLAGRLPSVIRLEIDVLLRERGPARSAPENIAVQCTEQSAHIEVTLDGSSRASTIDLHRLAAEHRPRAVALAAAELVHSMAGQPRAPQTSPTVVAPPATSRVEPERPTPDASRYDASRAPALLLGGLAEWRGNPAAPLFGARASFQYPLGKVVIPELSLDASFGEISQTSARVAIQSASTAAHFYFRATTGNTRWDLGAGARFGWAHLTGQPNAGSTLQGDSLAAAWGGPELRARVSYGASRLKPALLALQVGAGVVTLPVRGLRDGTESVYAVDGPWLSVCAEVGLGL